MMNWRTQSLRWLKVLHLLGLVLFLGSIFGHVVASVLGGEVGGATAFLMARRHISAATHWLTLPGLALSVLTGVAMWRWGSFTLRRHRWLLWHALCAALVVVLSLTVIVPAGQQALKEAQALATVSATSQDAVALRGSAERAKRVEDMAGGLNVLLTLAIVVLAVMRPQRRPSGRSDATEEEGAQRS